MPRSNTPWNTYWKEVSEDLRGVQDRVSAHQGRFRDAGRTDTADDLEHCMHLLLGAQCVAEELSLSRPDA